MEIDRTSKEEFLKRKKVEERILFTSMLSILLCCVMLAGSTLAWYTASVSTQVTSIQAGTLSVALQKQNLSPTTYRLGGENELVFQKSGMIDEEANLASEENATEAEDPGWIPGSYHILQPLWVVNSGTIDMKYQMFLDFKVGPSDIDNLRLLKALKFYVEVEMPEYETEANRSYTITFPQNEDEFNGLIKAINDADNQITGYEVKQPIFNEELEIRAAEQSRDCAYCSKVSIRVEMPNSVTTEYQGMTLGNIEIIVNASQLMPNDSVSTDFTAVSTAEELISALGNGGKIVFKNDIDISNSKLSIDAGKEVTLDLQGKKLIGNVEGCLIENKGSLTLTGGTVINDHENGRILDVITTGEGGETVTGKVILESVTLSGMKNVTESYTESVTILGSSVTTSQLIHVQLDNQTQSLTEGQ